MDDIEEQAMFLRNELMRRLWRPMLLLLLAALGSHGFDLRCGIGG